jgi:hypothetical protein
MGGSFFSREVSGEEYANARQNAASINHSGQQDLRRQQTAPQESEWD